MKTLNEIITIIESLITQDNTESNYIKKEDINDILYYLKEYSNKQERILYLEEKVKKYYRVLHIMNRFVNEEYNKINSLE